MYFLNGHQEPFTVPGANEPAWRTGGNGWLLLPHHAAMALALPATAEAGKSNAYVLLTWPSPSMVAEWHQMPRALRRINPHFDETLNQNVYRDSHHSPRIRITSMYINYNVAIQIIGWCACARTCMRRARDGPWKYNYIDDRDRYRDRYRYRYRYRDVDDAIAHAHAYDHNIYIYCN
jgi:hypothetical protein